MNYISGKWFVVREDITEEARQVITQGPDRVVDFIEEKLNLAKGTWLGRSLLVQGQLSVALPMPMPSPRVGLPRAIRAEEGKTFLETVYTLDQAIDVFGYDAVNAAYEREAPR